MNLFKDIEEFHNKFDLPRASKPALLSQEVLDFRIKFIEEELDEFIEACNNKNLELAFDALIDLTYVILGTAFIMGLPFNEGFKHVHECNLKKVRATCSSQSKRKSTLDVIKPEGWQAPNLSKFLK